MMYDVEEMVKLLKGRPGMYLGKKNTNTEELYLFLNGFIAGKSASEMLTALDVSFFRNFARYMFDWLDKNNKLNGKEFAFEWFMLLDSFGEEEISLFYLICENFFSDYHSHNLEEWYYGRDANESE